MKVLFIVNERRNDGPENWRRSLIHALRNNIHVVTFDGINLLELITKIMNSEIIHTYSPSPQSLIALILGKIMGKKLMHTVHGNYYQEYYSKRFIKKLLWLPFNVLLVKMAHSVTFPTNYLLKQVSIKQQEIITKSAVIPNGIDLDRIAKTIKYSKEELGLKKNDHLFLAVTNFNLKEKADGINLLVRDFNTYQKTSKKKSYLFIIGRGKLLDKYKVKYGTNNIRFLGFRKDVISYLKSSDIFLHYTFLDNFPLALLEAMACNKRILTTPVGGIPEFIPIEYHYTGKFRIPKLVNCKQIIGKYNIDKISLLFCRHYLEI